MSPGVQLQEDFFICYICCARLLENDTDQYLGQSCDSRSDATAPLDFFGQNIEITICLCSKLKSKN